MVFNPFQQGQQFAQQLEAGQLDIAATKRREEGINALVDIFGPTAKAPQASAVLRREERQAAAGKLEQERRATIDEEKRAEDERERGLQAAKATVGFLESAISNNVPFEEVSQKVTPALVALGIDEADVQPLLQQISADPSLLPQFKAAIDAQGKQTQGRFGVLTKAFDPTTGKSSFIQTTPGGGVQEIEGFKPDTRLAEQRATTAQRSVAVKEKKINPDLQFFLKGSQKAGAVTGERLNEGLTEARASLLTVEATQRLDQLIDQGIKTGSLAEARLGTARFFQTFLGRDDVEIENTDEFVGTQGRAVAEVIKAFGAGTGLSDADREFASKIAGQEISMNENAIRRLVGIVRKRAKRTIKEYNRDRDAFVKNVPALEEIFPKIGKAGKRRKFNPETGRIE